MTTTATSTQLDELCVNTIRTLSMDAVQAANSGHPGTPMALAPVETFIVSMPRSQWPPPCTTQKTSIWKSTTPGSVCFARSAFTSSGYDCRWMMRSNWAR